MLRHEMRFVLRFGVFGEFDETLERLLSVERRRGWSEQRCWRATAGRVNEIVVEHAYDDRAAYDKQRDAYHDVADEKFNAALADLATLIVPGTAVETLYEEL